MKKISIALLLSLVATFSFAQAEHAASVTATNTSSDSSIQPNKLTLRQQIQALNLSKDQKIQFRQIRQNSRVSKEAIITNDSLTQDQKQTQLMTLHKKTFASFKALLTDEQTEKWRSMRANRKNKNDQQQNEAMEEEIMSLPEN